MKRKKPASRKLAVQRTKPTPGAVVTVQNVNVPGYTSRVNAAKYVAMMQNQNENAWVIGDVVAGRGIQVNAG